MATSKQHHTRNHQKLQHVTKRAGATPGGIDPNDPELTALRREMQRAGSASAWLAHYAAPQRDALTARNSNELEQRHTTIIRLAENGKFREAEHLALELQQHDTHDHHYTEVMTEIETLKVAFLKKLSSDTLDDVKQRDLVLSLDVDHPDYTDKRFSKYLSLATTSLSAEEIAANTILQGHLQSANCVTAAEFLGDFEWEEYNSDKQSNYFGNQIPKRLLAHWQDQLRQHQMHLIKEIDSFLDASEPLNAFTLLKQWQPSPDFAAEHARLRARYTDLIKDQFNDALHEIQRSSLVIQPFSDIMNTQTLMQALAKIIQGYLDSLSSDKDFEERFYALVDQHKFAQAYQFIYDAFFPEVIEKYFTDKVANAQTRFLTDLSGNNDDFIIIEDTNPDSEPTDQASLLLERAFFCNFTKEQHDALDHLLKRYPDVTISQIESHKPQPRPQQLPHDIYLLVCLINSQPIALYPQVKLELHSMISDLSTAVNDQLSQIETAQHLNTFLETSLAKHDYVNAYGLLHERSMLPPQWTSHFRDMINLHQHHFLQTAQQALSERDEMVMAHYHAYAPSWTCPTLSDTQNTRLNTTKSQIAALNSARFCDLDKTSQAILEKMQTLYPEIGANSQESEARPAVAAKPSTKVGQNRSYASVARLFRPEQPAESASQTLLSMRNIT